MADKCICGNIATVIGPGGQEICRSCDRLIAKCEWDAANLAIIRAAGQRVFRFHWLNSDKFDDGIGDCVEDAFMKLGFGGGAIRAVDYYEVINENYLEKLKAG
jgi:hypothetical protein